MIPAHLFAASCATDSFVFDPILHPGVIDEVLQRRGHYEQVVRVPCLDRVGPPCPRPAPLHARVRLALSVTEASRGD